MTQLERRVIPRLPRVLILFVGAMTLVPCAPVRAQLYGVHSRAVDLATIDAAALGDTLPSSAGLFAADQWVVGAGVAAFGGALRAFVGSERQRVGIPYALGMGFARTIAAHDLLGPLHGAIGTELVAGFQHLAYAPHDAGALSLTAPLGLSIGDPSSTSLGLYAAPYVESGVMRSWESDPQSCSPYCTFRLSDTGIRSAAGLGVGGRAALGRWSLELFFRDVRFRNRQFYSVDEGALGVTYRLSR